MNFLRVIATALAIVLVTATTGCTTMSSGQKIDTAKVETIKDGVTTRAQVEQMMGRAPEEDEWMSQIGQHKLLWHYNATQVDGTAFIPLVGELFGKSTDTTQMLTVYVDKKGIVRSHVFSNGTTRSKSALETMQGK